MHHTYFWIHAIRRTRNCCTYKATYVRAEEESVEAGIGHRSFPLLGGQQGDGLDDLHLVRWRHNQELVAAAIVITVARSQRPHGDGCAVAARVQHSLLLRVRKFFARG